MRALPESRETLSRLAPADGARVVAELDRAAQLLEELVPGVIAFSVHGVGSGVTVTYVGALPDGHDPTACTAASLSSSTPDDVPRPGDPLDEPAWQRAALRSAAPGVRSSLSLPVLRAGRVVADVVVYGSGEGTFCGLRHRVAEIFGACAAGAVSNADLSFDTRRDAVAAAVRVTDLETVEEAAHLLAEERELEVGHVRDRLHSAAARAGIPDVLLARLVIEDRRHDA